MKAKQPTVQQRINAFVKADPFNALFVHEAIERYCAHVMDLKEEDHVRSIVSLCLVKGIAMDWAKDK